MSTRQFWGTWRLQSFEVRTSGEEVSYPYGRDAKGYLTYTHDGYMAVAVMKAHRANFDSSDMLSASVDEKRIAFDTFASYFGTYEVRENKVIHPVQLSLFPNWSGSDQERFFKFSADQLVLSTPMAAGVTAIVVWRRVQLTQD